METSLVEVKEQFCALVSQFSTGWSIQLLDTSLKWRSLRGSVPRTCTVFNKVADQL